tara:strand:+ start:2456 stop:3061 length:606 start_codon:yes stop_codon:yes gene_type:complete
MQTSINNKHTEHLFGGKESNMPFNWSVRSVENYSEISCATHMVGMNSEYPVFTVKDSSGYVIEEVKFTSLGDGQLAPLPNPDNEQELGLYLSRINAWIESNVTQAIVWATMTVGLNHISDKNIDEWIRRIELIKEAGFGDYIMFHDLQFDEDELKFKTQVRREINEDDLVRRIGLSTNAMTQNKSEFDKWLEKKTKELVKY